MQWFKNRIDAKVMIEDFRCQFNEVRPHSSLGQLTPLEFKSQLLQSVPDPELLPSPLTGAGRLRCGGRRLIHARERGDS
jgi:hypothetical protein